MNNRLRLPLALALALGTSHAWALGLGQIEVKSGLNQPLDAEIPVVANANEGEALKVRLASADAFTRVGLDRPATVAANLEFTVSTDKRGRTVIKVSTPSDVVEPFLTFLLEVDWGKGRMLREYTVLLDSPTMAPIQGAPAATTPISDASPSMAEALPPPSMSEPAAPAPRSSPRLAPSAPSAPSASAPSAPAYDGDSYGPVASGETLWSIAARTRPDNDISVNQMMLALLRANPDAFIGNNINRLRSGAVLRIPGRDDAVAMAAAEAASQVREQTQTWRETTQPAPQPADSYTGLVETPPPASSTSAPADSRLELTPPAPGGTASATQSGTTAGGEGRELRADLARSREEVGTLTQENVELKSRVGELEKIKTDSTRLIEMKDSELAAAQRRLADLEARAAAAGVASATPSTASALPPADEPMMSPLDGKPASPVVDPTVAPTDPTAVPTDPSVDPAAAAAVPADQVTEPMGFEPDAPAGTEALPADGSVATPLDATTAAEPVTPPPATEPAPAPVVAEDTPWYTNPWILGGGGLALVGLIALLAGRRRKAAAPVSPRYDSDSLAASVAAAQASAVPVLDPIDGDDREGDLIEAISRDPSDLQRHLELVRHYYDTGDAAGFENAAEAMYSRVYDPDDDAWQEVVALGQEIAPEHPLFVATGVAAADSIDAAPLAPEPREVAWDGAPVAFDNAVTQQMSRPAFTESLPPLEPLPPLDDFTYDTSADTAPSDLGDADESGSDAAATKLELARAYLDMGDVEGARGMLEEVLTDGTTSQRNDARRLLDEIR